MYNTDFKVKYYDIKNELIQKYSNETNDYTSDDILDVCNKLYMDELSSVFYAEDILDDKIDNGMKLVLEKMLINPDFKIAFDEMILLLNKGKSDFVNECEQENQQFITLLTLFSEDLFYVTHKCVCEQLLVGSIDANLLVSLKEKMVSILSNNS